jgi:CheY-like chemotaxis protein
VGGLEQSTGTTADVRQPTVLVVDDEPDILDVVSLMLNRDGCQTVPAADGRQALRAITQQPIDVVLLDLMMPDLSGLAVMRGIRRLCRRGGKPMPTIIVCSGYSQLVAQAMRQGGTFSLSKPFELHQLLMVVHSAVGQKAPG